MKLLNNIRLRNKMFLVYFLGVIAPIILTNVIFYNTITGNVKAQRIKDIDLAVEQIKNEFRLIVDQAVGLSSFSTRITRPMRCLTVTSHRPKTMLRPTTSICDPP